MMSAFSFCLNFERKKTTCVVFATEMAVHRSCKKYLTLFVMTKLIFNLF